MKKESNEEETFLLGRSSKSHPWYHPSRLLFRSIIMVMASFLPVGGYMAFDSVGAVAPQLTEALDMDATQLGILISAYSLPNLVLVVFGGFLVDKIGYRICAFLFSALVAIGSAVSAISLSLPDTEAAYLTILGGRFLSGLGNESLLVAQTAILTKWFGGKELAFALGVSLTFGRMGSILALWILPEVTSLYGLAEAFWVAWGFAASSLIMCLLLISLDSYGRNVLGEKVTQELKPSVRELLKGAREFSVSYWLIITISMCFYGSAMSFTTFSTDFFNDKWGIHPDDAARITSIVYLGSMVFSPVFGWIVDLSGYRLQLLLFGSAVLIPTFCLYAFTYVSPVILTVFLAISFSLVPSALWPCVPLVVSEKLIGLAFGLMFCGYNCALFVSPILFGYLRDTTGEWYFGISFFVGLVVFGTICVFALWYQDSRYNRNCLKQPSPDAVVPSCFKKRSDTPLVSGRRD